MQLHHPCITKYYSYILSSKYFFVLFLYKHMYMYIPAFYVRVIVHFDDM